MKTFVLFLIGFPVFSFAQSFPEDWLGTFYGKMKVAGRGSEQIIDVSLSIKPIENDSSWTYLMVYNAPSGKIEKNYSIRKGINGSYTLDEGGILIPLLFSNDCFYDHYVLDSMYFNSILSHRGNGILEFNLFGGSKKMNNQLTSSQDGTTVYAYLPSFSQRVVLKRRKK